MASKLENCGLDDKEKKQVGNNKHSLLDTKAIWAGVKATIIASSCCSLPLLIAMLSGTLGAGSLTAALKIPRYKTYFMFMGTAFLVISLYYSIKKRSGSCTLVDVKKHRKMIVLSVLTYVALTVLTIYYILPLISEMMFG